MGILTDLLVGNDASARAYHSAVDPRSAPNDVERAEFRGLLDLNFSILWSILQGNAWDLDAHALESVEVDDGGERWLFRFPDAFTDHLAQLDEATVAKSAAAWAKTEELQCQPDDIRPVIEALVSLARRAKASGKDLYLSGSL